MTAPTPLPPEPWKRLEDEPEDAWTAFVQYRDQPLPRSATRVKGARAEKQVAWYHLYRWIDRCKAWDRHLDSIRLDEKIEIERQTAAEVALEHKRMLKHARDLALNELEKLTNISLESELPGVIKPADVIKLTETVVKLDRLVRGESTDKTETDVDLSGMSVEELRQFQELLIKGGAGK